MEHTKPIIEIRDLQKSYSDRAVLNGVNLEIHQGETVVIIGRSGGGKTVLLKHVIGLIKPDSGSVKIDGKEITSLSEKELEPIRLKFGLLFQEGALFDSMTVFENVAFPLVEHKIFDNAGITARVEECLAHVGMEAAHNLYPEELSGGMSKRVGLARALAMNPEIMLYDEPTSGVDPLMRDDINKQIRQLDDELGVTALVVTHDVESALTIGDRIALLEAGKIVAEGTPTEIQNHENLVMRQFLKRDRERAL
jgi:phospholipid/cholesterol/gamma-HCH transport system ATP-binding protein